MPKISTNETKICHKDIDVRLKIVIMYNQKWSFYSIIPEEYKDAIQLLSKDDKKENKLREMYLGKFPKHGEEPKYIVHAENEYDCLNQAQAVIKVLLTNVVKKRDVIIVFYNPKNRSNYNNHLYNKEHDQIGLQFGLTYAVESSVEDKKVYSMYTEVYSHTKEKEYKRDELSLWNESATIIDDTPKNREMLEALYTSLHTINTKLTEFMKSPDALAEFIKVGMKALAQ
jgi:hypothetical protein